MKRTKPLKRSPLPKPTLAQVQAWQRKPRKRIRQQSRAPKKVEARKLYNLLILELRVTFPMCQMLGCMRATVDPHHIEGRVGALLYDRKNILMLCRFHHDKIHRHPKWAREQGYLK